jgi:hypothetical protein
MAILGKLIKRGIQIGEKIDNQFDQIPPINHQRRVLRRLLRKAQHTTFGKYYGFKDILKSKPFIQAFQEQVPRYDYDTMHDRWWHMSLNKVDNVTWPGKVKYFALSSGTSGAPSKHIPITDDMTRAMRKAGLKTFLSLSNFDIAPDLFTKEMMMLGGTSDLLDQGGFYAGDLSGINASKPPFWLRPYYKPGARISRINEWDSRLAAITDKAPSWDIGYIVGIPSWLQLMMERIIDQYKLDTIHDIWPNLQVCVHGGVHFEPYKKGFERLMGKPLIYMDTYLASEGFIAFQERPETRAMRLLLHCGIFFEFIPFREEYFDEDGNPIGDPPVLSIDQVEEGENYALLLSTCAGAWRYAIGDTVQFTDKERSEIIITGRTKHYLSICGEHLSIDNMNQGIQAVERAFNLSIPEFTVAAVEDGNFFAHQWYIGTPRPEHVTEQQMAAVLDEALSAVNADYATERTSVLKDIRIQSLPIEVFYDYHRHHGRMGGQNKFPRVMKGQRLETWQDFLHKKGYAARST